MSPPRPAKQLKSALQIQETGADNPIEYFVALTHHPSREHHQALIGKQQLLIAAADSKRATSKLLALMTLPPGRQPGFEDGGELLVLGHGADADADPVGEAVGAHGA